MGLLFQFVGLFTAAFATLCAALIRTANELSDYHMPILLLLHGIFGLLFISSIFYLCSFFPFYGVILSIDNMTKIANIVFIVFIMIITTYIWKNFVRFIFEYYFDRTLDDVFEDHFYQLLEEEVDLRE